MKRIMGIRKFMYILLAFAVSFSVAACSSEEPQQSIAEISSEEVSENESVYSAETEEPEYSEEKKTPVFWDGAEVSILCEEKLSQSDMYFSEDDVSVYSSLASRRDLAISDSIGVSIKYDCSLDVFDQASHASDSGDGYFVVYASGGGGMSSLMLHGYLDDLSKSGEVNTSAVSVSLQRQLSIEGSLYMLTGAPMRSSVANTAVTAYDKTMLSSMGYGDGYLEELAHEGMWTHDVMHRLIKECKNTGLSGSEDSLYYLWQGMGAVTMQKTAGDIPEVAIYTPRNVFYFEHVHQFHADVGEVSFDGSSLFMIDNIDAARTKLRDNAAILPLPLYHEGGEYTCVLDFANTYFTAIPSGVHASGKLAHDYLTALYTCSLDTTYREVISMYASGNEDMLDLILKSRYFDFLDMYGIGHIMKTAFSPDSETEDFDKLLEQRAKFTEQALDIVLRNTVG